MALFQKAELLEKSESFKEAVGIYEKILFYRPDEFNALDAIDSLVAGHGLDYEPSPQYVQSLDLRKRARKRAEKIDDCLDSVEIGEYDEDYVRGCSKFKDYKSIDEYIRDLIICLMERYPGRSEEMSRHLVKVNMDYVRSSYEHGEPADYCSIEVGYCCG